MTGTKLSKSDLIAKVAESTECSKKEVKKIVDALFDNMADCIADGGTVTIQGFARFFTKEAQPRAFRKINSDEVVEVGVRQLPKTKFSKNFVERVKG